MEPIKYIFVQKTGDEFSCIKIIEGEFKNVVYTYRHVKFAPEENDEGKLPLKFTYDVHLNPNNVNVKSEEFKNCIGDILIDVVEQQLKNNQVIFKDGDKDIK